MSVAMIGYLVKGPPELDTSKETEKKAKAVYDKAVSLISKHFESKDGDEEALKTLRKEYMLLADEVEMNIQDMDDVPSFDSLIKGLKENWPPSDNYSTYRLDPDDRKNTIIAFTGLSSYGDEPDGPSYQALKWADIFNLLDVYNIR